MIDEAQLQESLENAVQSGEFRDGAWLTFYLSGQRNKLEALSEVLVTLGGRNLDGAEGGFVYAKFPTALEAEPIKGLALTVCNLAKQHSVEIALIDLDSSPDVFRSTFFSIYQDT